MENKAILLVEDNADDEELTLQTLKKNNIMNEVVVARDGETAIEYLFGTGCSGRYPVVVMLDIRLPKINGLEVLRRIRADSKTKFLPVVILTSSDEEKDLVDSYRLGANSYVKKPVNFVDFQKAIGQLTLYWLILNQAPQI
jgi:two-component system response regulator